jgi:dephospho-CoA kinase
MKVIGLLGGIASGKSLVAAELTRLGAVVLDADQAAHDVLQHQAVRDELVERWGSDILNPLGEIDRRRVAEIVFPGDGQAETELKFLEGVLHPRIRGEFESRLNKLRNRRVGVAVIDAPLLLEAGWGDLCDYTLFVEADRATRLQRARSRGWSELEFTDRERAQLPIDQKRVKSTHQLSNEGSAEELKGAVRQFWEGAVGPVDKT